MRFNLCETVMPLCVRIRCINHSLHIGLNSEAPKPEKSDLNETSKLKSNKNGLHSQCTRVFLGNNMHTQTRNNPYW